MPSARRASSPSSTAIGVGGVALGDVAVGVVPVVHGRARGGWSLTPAASPALLRAAASPVARGDGVVEVVDQVALVGQQLEELGLVRLDRGRALRSSAIAKKRRGLACGRRTGRRPRRPRWRSGGRDRVAGADRVVGEHRRIGAGGRLEGVEHAPVERRPRRRAGWCWRSPAGTGRGGTRRPRAPRRIRPASVERPQRRQPDAEPASRWSGIASGAHASRWSRSHASASRSVGAGEDRVAHGCRAGRRRRGRASR